MLVVLLKEEEKNDILFELDGNTNTATKYHIVKGSFDHEKFSADVDSAIKPDTWDFNQPDHPTLVFGGEEVTDLRFIKMPLTISFEKDGYKIVMIGFSDRTERSSSVIEEA